MFKTSVHGSLQSLKNLHLTVLGGIFHEFGTVYKEPLTERFLHLQKVVLVLAAPLREAFVVPLYFSVCGVNESAADTDQVKPFFLRFTFHTHTQLSLHSRVCF